MLDGPLLDYDDHIGGRSTSLRICWNESLLMMSSLAVADVDCRCGGRSIA